MTVYVLTALVSKAKGGEWRPVAVVDSEHTADQWIALSPNNDWIPFELNDISTTDLAVDLPTSFKPGPPPPEPTAEKATRAAQKLEETNTKLIGIIEQLAKKYKDKAVLNEIEKLRQEGKAEWPEAKQSSMHWDLTNYPEQEKARIMAAHAPNCKLLSSGKCSCKPCPDCGADFDVGKRTVLDQPHKQKCPRMAQESLFGSDLLRRQ